MFYPSSSYSLLTAFVVAYIIYPLQTFCRYITTFLLISVAREQLRAVHSPLTYRKRMASISWRRTMFKHVAKQFIFTFSLVLPLFFETQLSENPSSVWVRKCLFSLSLSFNLSQASKCYLFQRADRYFFCNLIKSFVDPKSCNSLLSR